MSYTITVANTSSPPQPLLPTRIITGYFRAQASAYARPQWHENKNTDARVKKNSQRPSGNISIRSACRRPMSSLAGTAGQTRFDPLAQSGPPPVINRPGMARVTVPVIERTQYSSLTPSAPATQVEDSQTWDESTISSSPAAETNAETARRSMGAFSFLRRGRTSHGLNRED